MDWYAIYTRSRHEQRVNERLGRKGVESFLPMFEQWSRRKDRRSRMRLPLFPGYLFVQTEMDACTHLNILKTDGVVRLLCHESGPAPIPNEQIQGLQVLMKNGVSMAPYPYLKEGTRIRVVNGPLTGIEGILLKNKPGKHRLVLSVDLLKESVSIEIDEFDVEPIYP